MELCSCKIKSFFLIFNFICLLLGIFIIILGFLSHSNGKPFEKFLQGEIATTSTLLIVIGVLVLLITLFGCCGIITENHCMITTYAITFSAILLVQVTVGVMAFVYHKKFTKELRIYVTEDFDKYDKKKQEIDALQITIHCCGPEGPDRWSKISFPASCCKNLEDGERCTEPDAYPDGCIGKSEILIKKELQSIGLAALIMAVFEFIAIVCAFSMAMSIRRG